MAASPENVFSSLVGLQFSWQLLPKSLEAESMHRLIHVPLKETPLGDCVSGFCEDLDVQLQLEDKGLGSNLYVVKGIGIGHEIVKAKLLEPQLEHLEDEITLTVAEAMSLDPPSPIFVTVGSLIYYSLRVIHGNTHQGGVRLHEWLFRLLRSRSTSLLRRRSLLLSDRKLRHFHWK
ncbi:nuclear pore complex protein GP210-like isoform X2 [Dendrobium catenatum]|uniref:nuclear pore complex protein GP210-like isoform X2 n=1 Tax=Dendrobium catenatum TaxID=906689 RepID=UPI0009F5E298|nr:nuclear pore complex protein GP210-like isoform X2 [Dendrobium catenatum]